MIESQKKLPFALRFFFKAGVPFILVGIVLAIAISNFHNCCTSPAGTCINTLRQIDGAAQQFAFEKGKTNGQAINFPDDLTPYIKLDKNGEMPSCPSGGTYTLNKVGDKPTCSLGTTVNPPHVLP